MGSKNEEKGFSWLEVDLSDVFYLLRRHIAILCLAPLVGGLLAYSATKLMRPVFRSSALVYLRPNFDKEMQLEQTYSKLEDDDSLRSIERSMVSDTIILRMVNKLNLRTDEDFLGEAIPAEGHTDAMILKKIRKRYATELVPTTRLVELKVDDFSAERTTEIANTLIDEFLKHLRDDRNIKEAELRETLIVQAQKALEGALESEKKLKVFRTDNPDTLVEQDSSIFQERILQNGTDLNEANSERSRLAGTLSALESIDPEEHPYRVFQLLSNRNSTYLSDLLTMQAAAKSEFAGVKERVTERHPDYLAASSRLEEVDATLRRYAVEMKESMLSEYQAATQKAENLNATLTGLRGDFVGFKTSSAEFRGLKEEIDRNWNTNRKLQQKIMDLDLDPEVTPTFVTVVSKPIVPDKKAKPFTLVWVAVGLLLGGAFAAATVFWRNRNGLPFTSSEQALAQLGGTSMTKVVLQENGEAGIQADSALFNILISLRSAQLVHLTALDQDGTADSLSGHLSKLCAHRGSRTLLLAFSYELRKPGSIVVDPRIPKLARLELPTDLLTNGARFSAGLQALLKDFDRIFVDTTTLDEPEGRLAVAGVADANILVVGSEPRKEHRQFVELCRAHQIRSIDLVYLTGSVPPETGNRGQITDAAPVSYQPPFPSSPRANPSAVGMT